MVEDGGDIVNNNSAESRPMGEHDPRAVAVRYGPVALLVVLAAMALWIRLLPVEQVLTDARVTFSGTDAWYHRRMVGYAVAHFPGTTPFDPWSNFPTGTGHHSGFGGLFDQLVAAGAIVLGLGSPDERLVDVVLALAPTIFGALTLVPTYLLARRLTDRWGGLVASGLLVLTGGGFLTRTVIGAADHQSAEPLFATLAVAGVAWAIATARDEKPTVVDLCSGVWTTVRRPILAGCGAGVAIAAYLALWPPGVVLFVPIGAFLVVQLARDHVAGQSSTPIVVATVLASAVAGMLALTVVRSVAIEPSGYSLLQPLVAFGLAGAAVTLGLLAREFDRRGIARRRFPVAVAGTLVLVIAVTWLAVPRGGELLGTLLGRVFSFGLLTSPEAGTVAEVRPATLDEIVATYGGMLVLALVGLMALAVGVARENRPVWLLVLFWSLTTVAATFTMARFAPYLAVTVAILGGVGVRWVRGRIPATGNWSVATIDRRHVTAVALILVLVVPGNVVAVGDQEPVWEEADAPWGSDATWFETLDWLRSNTPAEPLAYYHRYERPTDGDFDYPMDAYGVVSRWDAGHWITSIGRRVPYANPFQEGTVPTAAFFVSTGEERANRILAALPALSESSGVEATADSDDLRRFDRTASNGSSEDARYVIVDHEMVTSGFPSTTDWVGPDLDAYLQRERYRVGGRNATLQSTNDRYDGTMLAELYRDDASTLGHYRLVHEADRYAIVGSVLRDDRERPLTSRPLDGDWNAVVSLADRVESAEEGGTVGRSGRGRFVAGEGGERVGQAVEIGPDVYTYDAAVESRVKVYERVDGATIGGSVPGTDDATPVVATLELRTHTGRTFTYDRRTTVDADDSIRLRVAYPTDDAVDTAAGGTNASVRALGEYHVRVGEESSPVLERNVSVPESAMYGNETVRLDD